MTRIITFLFALYCSVTYEQRKKHKPASQPLDNMEQQKALLLTRIRGMKYAHEARYYQFEIRDFVNKFLFDANIGKAKEDLKLELQMQVNELSIPTLINA